MHRESSEQYSHHPGFERSASHERQIHSIERSGYRHDLDAVSHKLHTLTHEESRTAFKADLKRINDDFTRAGLLKGENGKDLELYETAPGGRFDLREKRSPKKGDAGRAHDAAGGAGEGEPSSQPPGGERQRGGRARGSRPGSEAADSMKGESPAPSGESGHGQDGDGGERQDDHRGRPSRERHGSRLPSRNPHRHRRDDRGRHRQGRMASPQEEPERERRDGEGEPPSFEPPNEHGSPQGEHDERAGGDGGAGRGTDQADRQGGRQLPESLEKDRQTLGTRSDHLTKDQTARAMGAAAAKIALDRGLSAETAQRLAQSFVTAGITETMDTKNALSPSDQSLDNTRIGDGRTSFGPLQLHKGGQLTDDIRNGRHVRDQLSPEQAFTPNIAVQRSFNHLEKQLNKQGHQLADLDRMTPEQADKTIFKAFKKAQAAGDSRYENKYWHYHPQARELLARNGFYDAFRQPERPPDEPTIAGINI